mgnify:CR=1 FL=1
MKGLVIKNTGSWYLVKTEDGRTIECKIKGNFRLKGNRSTNPIAVVAYVQIIITNEGTAIICEIARTISSGAPLTFPNNRTYWRPIWINVC